MCAYQAGDSLLKLGYVCGVGGLHRREKNPLQTPHQHVMEHLQNRNLPPESRHNSEICPAPDSLSQLTNTPAAAVVSVQKKSKDQL